ncbi:putative VP1 [Microviridae sp.]|nr:putative VP1 [Microviridae sp.]
MQATPLFILLTTLFNYLFICIMNVNKNVQRNTINEARVKMSDVQKSGFDLSYSSQTSGGIGKLLPTSVQWIMAGDKFSGSNSINAQFEPLAVPMSGRLKVESHNFFVRMRNIYGRDWEDYMIFNAGETGDVKSLPTFNLKELMLYLESNKFPSIPAYSDTAAKDLYDAIVLWASSAQNLADFTTVDFMVEYRQAILNFAAVNPYASVTTQDAYVDYAKTLLYLVCDKLVGEGSYLDFFGYPIIDHRTVDKFISEAISKNASQKFSDLVTDVPLNDAPIRAFYYVWYAYYRNIYTEPKKRCINPRSWSATPLDYATLFKLLVPRFRNWDIDTFTGAQTDDVSRHVSVVTSEIYQYDNVLYSEANGYSYNTNSQNYAPVDAGTQREYSQEGIISQDIHWIDTEGTTHVQTIPVPSIFGSAFMANRGSVYSTNEGGTTNFMANNLPLLQLRRTQMLERYLKRCFYSGDLYADYMKGIYGTTISDAISNIPEYIPGGSSVPVNVSQEVNNTSTEYSPAGTKTAVMQADAAGDSFVKFADEFGLYLNIMSFLPECSYDGMPNQLLYTQLFDFPIPQFSQQDDEHSHRFELSRTAVKTEQDASFRPFAHHPYKHDWRGRVNDFHGNALSTRKVYNFGRLFNYQFDDNTPKLNASFLHCKPQLDMFISSNPLNDVWFGYIDHKFYVERALSAFTETI